MEITCQTCGSVWEIDEFAVSPRGADWELTGDLVECPLCSIIEKKSS